jgi:hypothetical protein
MAEFNDIAAARGGASVGAYFRLPLTRENGRAPRAQIGLRVAAIRDHRNFSAPAGPVHQTDALDLRLVGTPKPTLLVAGRPPADLSRERLNLSTGATVGIVVGGAALLLLLAVAAAGPGFPGCPTIEGRRDHCID